MTVVVEGMDMPKACYYHDEQRRLRECPLLNYDVYCSILRRTCQFYEGKRPDDCPCKEVPTPHGRLIDADELIKHDHQHYEHLSDEFYITVRDIENAPTVIEAEEGNND